MEYKISKAWNWNECTNEIWFKPCEESYYLIKRWKEKGFNNFLDLGCGRGRHSIQFAKAGFNVKAIDLSPVAIEGLIEWANKENLDIHSSVGDMMYLPYSDKSFDCLLSYHVISHTDSIGIKKIISEIYRVLKEGGEFYITFCSKKAWSYKEAGFPKIDENTVIKTENGVEKNIPHFYVDDITIKEILSDFKLITIRHIQDLVVDGENYGSWHYFVLGTKEG